MRPATLTTLLRLREREREEARQALVAADSTLAEMESRLAACHSRLAELDASQRALCAGSTLDASALARLDLRRCELTRHCHAAQRERDDALTRYEALRGVALARAQAVRQLELLGTRRANVS